MAGLLDQFGYGTDPNASPYGGPQQAGLLGFLAGLQRSGALDYTLPTISGKMPAGFFGGLAGGAGGMLAGQDAYTNRMKTLAETGLATANTQKVGLEGQMLKAQTGLYNAALNDTAPPIFPPSTAAPGGQPAGGEAPSGLLPALGAAVEQVESGGKSDAVSPAGAIGLRQIMPSTAADYGVTDKNSLFDPNTNRQLGDKILGDLYGRYNGNLDATLVAYNAGPKVADKFVTAGGNPSVLPAETRAYIPKVKATLAAMQGGQTPALLAGYQGGRSNQLPAPAAPQGLLPQPAGNAAAAPAGGLLAQAAAGQPPAPSPAPQPAPAAPAATMPGGIPTPPSPPQINPAYVQWAQRQANINAALGRQTPPYVTEASGMPFVGPKAGAEAWGKVPADLYSAWHKPMDMRVNGMVIDPSTGRIVARNPAVPEGYTVGQGPNGQPIAEEVPNAIPGIARSEQAKVGGKYQAEFGGIPGVQPGAPTQPSAPASTPSKEPIPTPRGTLLPPTSQQFMPQSPSELEHAIPAWQKKTDEWNAGIAPARQAEMRLTTIAEAFKMTESGAFETHKAELGAMLKGLGIDPALVMQTNPAAVQEALHDNILTTLPLLKAATPRPSQIEFMSVSQNREHPNLQPSANLRMLSEDIALVRQAQQLPADWNMAQQQGWRNPQSFETAWSTLNPLDKARSQAAKEVGPLKGMPGSVPPPNAAVQHLKMNPKLRGDFDAKYGEGAAAKVLGQ